MPQHRVNFVCSVDGCGRPAWNRQLCRRHYARWSRYGDPLAGAAFRGTIAERLATYTAVSEGCWLWIGHRDRNGYGRLHVDGTPALAHRLSFEQHRGPIPAGLELDHLCRTPACVRPDHLEAVTHAENMRRWREAVAA